MDGDHVFTNKNNSTMSLLCLKFCSFPCYSFDWISGTKTCICASVIVYVFLRLKSIIIYTPFGITTLSVTPCISHLSLWWEQIPNTHNLKQVRLISAWSASSTAGTSWQKGMVELSKCKHPETHRMCTAPQLTHHLWRANCYGWKLTTERWRRPHKQEAPVEGHRQRCVTWHHPGKMYK